MLPRFSSEMSRDSPSLSVSDEAGPSRRPFFPPPFKLTDYQPLPDPSPAPLPLRPTSSSSAAHTRSRLPSHLHSSPAPSNASFTAHHGRASTAPLLHSVSARSRSRSATPQQRLLVDDDYLLRARYQSTRKCVDTWQQIMDKYGSIRPEDDDEIDLATGRVVHDRGRLRQLQGREFGDVSDDESGGLLFGLDGGVGGTGPESHQFDEDEDELGEWGDRSGLDEQGAPESPEPPTRPWTREDDEDLQAFLRADAEQRLAADEDGRERSLTRSLSGSPYNSADEYYALEPHMRRTRISITASEEPLSEHEQTDDELAAEDSDAEEVRRITPAPVETDISRYDDNMIDSMDVNMNVPVRFSSPILSRFITKNSRSLRAHTALVSSASSLRFSQTNISMDDIFSMVPRDEGPDDAGPSVSPVQGVSRVARISRASRMSTGSMRVRFAEHTEVFPLTSPPRSGRVKGKQRETRDETPRINTGGTTLVRRAATPGRRVVDQEPIEIDDESDDEDNWRELSNTIAPSKRSIKSTPRAKFTPLAQSTSLPSSTIVHQSPVFIPDPNDTDRYFSKLHYNRNGLLRHCVACRKAGGDRAELDVWCKGRFSASRCSYEFALVNSPSSRPPVQKTNSVERSRSKGGDESSAATSSSEEEEELDLESGSGDDDMDSSDAAKSQNEEAEEDDEDEDDWEDEDLVEGLIDRTPRAERHQIRTERRESSASISPTVMITPTVRQDAMEQTSSGRVRVARGCQACRAAGGERAEGAIACPGRFRRNHCIWFNAADASPVVVRDQPAPTLATPLPALPRTTANSISVSPSTPTVASTLTGRRQQSVPTDENTNASPIHAARLILARGKTSRRCRACRHAGGERAEMAEFCPGRIRPSLCPSDLPVDQGGHAPSADDDSARRAREGTEFAAAATFEPDAAGDEKPSLRYLADRLMRSTKRGYRRCHLCFVAGGKRAELAEYCAGRVKPALCSFNPSPVRSRSRSKSRAATVGLGSPTTPMSVDGVRRAQTVDPIQVESAPGRLIRMRTARTASVNPVETSSFTHPRLQALLPPPTLTSTPAQVPVRAWAQAATPMTPTTPTEGVGKSRKGRPRKLCLQCLEAGGERRDSASFCPGRRSGVKCKYLDSGDVDGEPNRLMATAIANVASALNAAAVATSTVPTPGPVTVPTPPSSAEGLDDTDLHLASEQHEGPPEGARDQDSPYLPHLRRTAHSNHPDQVHYFTCRLCVAAGGERARYAKWCKGRNKWSKCRLEKRVGQSVPREGEREEVTSTAEGGVGDEGGESALRIRETRSGIELRTLAEGSKRGFKGKRGRGGRPSMAGRRQSSEMVQDATAGESAREANAIVVAQANRSRVIFTPPPAPSDSADAGGPTTTNITTSTTSTTTTSTTTASTANAGTDADRPASSQVDSIRPRPVTIAASQPSARRWWSTDLRDRGAPLGEKNSVDQGDTDYNSAMVSPLSLPPSSPPQSTSDIDKQPSKILADTVNAVHQRPTPPPSATPDAAGSSLSPSPSMVQVPFGASAAMRSALSTTQSLDEETDEELSPTPRFQAASFLLPRSPIHLPSSDPFERVAPHRHLPISSPATSRSPSANLSITSSPLVPPVARTGGIGGISLGAIASSPRMGLMLPPPVPNRASEGRGLSSPSRMLSRYTLNSDEPTSPTPRRGGTGSGVRYGRTLSESPLKRKAIEMDDDEEDSDDDVLGKYNDHEEEEKEEEEEEEEEEEDDDDDRPEIVYTTFTPAFLRARAKLRAARSRSRSQSVSMDTRRGRYSSPIPMARSSPGPIGFKSDPASKRTNRAGRSSLSFSSPLRSGPRPTTKISSSGSMTVDGLAEFDEGSISGFARKRSRLESRTEYVANGMDEDIGSELEWGLDDDAGDVGRLWRESSVVDRVG